MGAVSPAVQKKRDAGAKKLTDAGIPFERLNDGAHLVIRVAGRDIDYWPGPGKWVDRRIGGERTGVAALVAYIKTAKRTQERIKRIAGEPAKEGS